MKNFQFGNKSLSLRECQKCVTMGVPTVNCISNNTMRLNITSSEQVKKSVATQQNVEFASN